MTDEAFRTAAERAGLVDMDLLKIVKPGLRADDAVAELRSRFPGAFRTAVPQAKDVRGMKPADARAEIKRWLGEMATYDADESQRRETAKTYELAAARQSKRNR